MSTFAPFLFKLITITLCKSSTDIQKAKKKKKLPSEGPYIRGQVERTFPPAAYFSLEPSLDQKQMLPIEAVYKALKIN